ncbi:MAG: tyrosine-type recombinase/integrase [Sphingorhabdus sp.]
MRKLTAKFVSAASAGRHQDGDGLILNVKPSGAKSWMLRIQMHGKRRDIGLGSAKDISLAQAREKASEIRKEARSGIDPLAKRQAAKRAARQIPDFQSAAYSVFEEQKQSWKNEKHKEQWISSLEQSAFPDLGKLPVNQITGLMIRDCLLGIWLEKPETARRVKQRIGTVLDWSYANGYRDSEAPMRSITRGLPRQPKSDKHFAAIPYADVPTFFSQLCEADSIGKLALRFLILTAARSGEVRGVLWSEVDLTEAIWTVPAEKMKAGREHIVPLSEPALAILRAMKDFTGGGAGDPIFPGRANKQMAISTLYKVLKTNWTDHATVHGFRSSFRDWAAESTSTQGEIVEAALAHTAANKVEAAYRRTNYLEKRKPLMQAWAAHVTRTAGDNVVTFDPSRKSA